MVLKRRKYGQHFDNNKFMYGLFYCLFATERDRAYEFWQLKPLRPNLASQPPRAQVKPSVAVHPSRELDNKRRIPHNVSQSFKHEEMFSGTLSEVVMKYLMNYEEAIMSYKLSEAQLSQCLHNRFDVEPKRVYRD